MMKKFLDTFDRLNPASKNIPSEKIKIDMNRRGPNSTKIRSTLPRKKKGPTKSQKTPKNYFSHVPKFCSTNIETVDPSTFLSLFHEDITPLDDPT